MQKVRKDERLQGKKRPTGRDGSRKDGPLQTSSTSPTIASTSRRKIVNRTASVDSNEDSPTSSVSPTNRVQQQQTTDVPKSPSPGRLDPFATLPGGLEISKIVDQLIQYCTLPSSFVIRIS